MTSLNQPDLLKAIHQQLPEWSYDENKHFIQRKFQFEDFYQTMAFINAMAWLAHQHNHHPDFEAGYHYCHVKYSTHDAGGVTLKDLQSAKAIDALFDMKMN